MASSKPWLRIWTMLAALCSVAAVAFVGGFNYLIIGAAVGIILGHVYSWRHLSRNSYRPTLVLIGLFVVIVILMRHDLWLIFSGTTLPLAHLFLIGQALGSFELRNRMSIYRSLVLSGLTFVIASVAAVSVGYLLCLGAFVLLTMATMATASLKDQTRGSTYIHRGKQFRLVPFWLGSTLSFLVISGLLFWSFPRISVISQAAPGYLPSHMVVMSNQSPALPAKPSTAADVLPPETEPEDVTQRGEQVEAVEEDATVTEANIEHSTSQPSADAAGGAKLSEPSRQETAHTSQADKDESNVERLTETKQNTNQGVTHRVNDELANLEYPSSGDTVVMNVRSPVASYWRGLVLDKYDGIRWTPSLNRSSLEFEKMGGNGTSGLRKAQYWQTYYMQTDAPNPLFMGYNPLAIVVPEGGVKVIKKKGESTRFQVAGNLPYRALSRVPDYDIDELRRDVAWHRDPAYLALPPIPARVSTLTREVVQSATVDFDKVVRLERFLQQNYSYGDASYFSYLSGESTDTLLFQQQRGICSQFASAMAVMARLDGLPARVAIGYRPGSYDLWSGTYAVRAGDAHAWVEIHFQDHGWVPFDPTPASQGQSKPLLPLPHWNGLAKLPVGQFGFSITGPAAGALTKLTAFKGWGKTATRALAILSFILVLAFSGVLVLRRFGNRSKQGNELFGYSRIHDPERQRMLKFFQKLETVLAKSGFRRRRPSETLAEYTRAASRLLPRRQETVKWLTETTSRAAYDPQPFSESLVREAAQRVRSIGKSLF